MRRLPAVALVVATALSTGCIGTPMRQPPPLQRVASMRAGTNGAHGFRTSVLAVTRDGGPHRSTPQQVIHPVAGTSLVVDRGSGRVFLSYNCGPPGIGFWNAQQDSNPLRDLHPHYL